MKLPHLCNCVRTLPSPVRKDKKECSRSRRRKTKNYGELALVLLLAAKLVMPPDHEQSEGCQFFFSFPHGGFKDSDPRPCERVCFT